jgi:hypothetical protein
MGIGMEEWRQRIGSFSPYGVIYVSAIRLKGLTRYARVTPCWACVICLILIIGGVELNTFSKMDDIIQRLDNLMQKF